MSEIIEIDGSEGEGGGQILRTSISLSAVTKKPVRVTNIRANRPNPGLSHQHVAGIRAVEAIASADTKGVEKGSPVVEFYPGEVEGGEFKFQVGTAGSITLVLQACLLPALFAKERLSMTITGGTDVKWSPPADYFLGVHLPLLRKMGIDVKASLKRRGHYPRGGGEMSVEFLPSEKSEKDASDLRRFGPLEASERGEPLSVRGVAHVNNLPFHIAERMKKSALKKLMSHPMNHPAKIRIEEGRGASPGTGIVLWAEFPGTVLGSSALGEKGVSAEAVGEKAAADLLEDLASAATLDVHSSDQVLTYAALAKGASTFFTGEITRHTETNMLVIKKFLEVDFDVKRMEEKRVFEVNVVPRN